MSTSPAPSPSPSPEQLACLSAAQDDANTSFSNTPVGAPVASCDQHWVSVKLMRQPDEKQRPSWWPVPDKAPYPSEKYRAQITNGATSGSLNGDGAVRFDRIPAGTNKFAFTAFYKDVEDFSKKSCRATRGARMGNTRTVRWDKVDEPIPGLNTDQYYEVHVQREAIPLIFVPGIMGSRLRLAGTDGAGDGPDGLPNLRWDPGSSWYMFNNYSGADGEFRKRMLVGSKFSSGFLEVDNTSPVADGFHGIMEDYWKKFLSKLKQKDWGPLGKIFEFPVYAFGYNWTDDNVNSGAKLAARIQDIIQEAKQVTGLCQKVILITHSMGGLVARWASQQAGAQGSILGVIHGVQPATGATAAYWRIKAGFEGLRTSRVLGHSAREVTPILGNIPGGLELLPNKLHRANDGSIAWLKITGYGQTVSKPESGDPYSDVYRRPAVVRPKKDEKASTNEYWGLVDPDLLDPHKTKAKPHNLPPPSGLDALHDDAVGAKSPWDQYLTVLSRAESFHDALQNHAHDQTYCFRGVGHSTADLIELACETSWFNMDTYPNRGFRGFFTDKNGKSWKAVIQEPAGGGDGTVPEYSAAGATLAPQGKSVPGQPNPADFKIEHQPAYEDSAAQTFTEKAIIDLCKKRYAEFRNPIFPAQSLRASPRRI